MRIKIKIYFLLFISLLLLSLLFVEKVDAGCYVPSQHCCTESCQPGQKGGCEKYGGNWWCFDCGAGRGCFEGCISGYQTQCDEVTMKTMKCCSENQVPKGWHDASDSASSRGWACDPDNYSQSLAIHFYKDGPAGIGTFIGSTIANIPAEQGVCNECGGYCNHRFDWPTPEGLKDGASHEIYAYAIDASGEINPLLNGSPKTLISSESTLKSLSERELQLARAYFTKELPVSSAFWENLGEVLPASYQAYTGAVLTKYAGDDHTSFTKDRIQQIAKSYDIWKEKARTPLVAYPYGMAAWLMWDNLPPALQEKVKQQLIEQSMWAIENYNEWNGATGTFPWLTMFHSNMLSLTYNMFPYAPEAQNIKHWAGVFAFHMVSLSSGETDPWQEKTSHSLRSFATPLKTENVIQMDGIWPNAHYALLVAASMRRNELNYIMGGQDIEYPQVFNHNFDLVWEKHEPYVYSTNRWARPISFGEYNQEYKDGNDEIGYHYDNNGVTPEFSTYGYAAAASLGKADLEKWKALLDNHDDTPPWHAEGTGWRGLNPEYVNLMLQNFYHYRKANAFLFVNPEYYGAATLPCRGKVDSVINSRNLVRTGEVQTFTIKIKNTGSNDLKGTKIIDEPWPDRNCNGIQDRLEGYTQDQPIEWHEIYVGDLPAGSSVEKSWKVVWNASWNASCYIHTTYFCSENCGDQTKHCWQRADNNNLDILWSTAAFHSQTTCPDCEVEGKCQNHIEKLCTSNDAKDYDISQLGNSIDDYWCTYNEHDGCKYVKSGVELVAGQMNPEYWEGESCEYDDSGNSSILWGEKKVYVDDISKYAIRARLLIDDNSWVWINGSEVPGLHRGCCGWTDWQEVTTYFHTGWNEIKFKAEDRCSGERYFNLDWDIDFKVVAGNQLPEGSLDKADCNAFWGWARDPDTKEAIYVHLYYDGPAGSDSGVYLGSISANQYRGDLCNLWGNGDEDCYHGFFLEPPDILKDGREHQIYAYGIDSQGGQNPLLENCPKTIKCTPLCPVCKNLSIANHNTDCSQSITLEPSITVPVSILGSDPDGIKEVSIFYADKTKDRTIGSNWTKIGGGSGNFWSGEWTTPSSGTYIVAGFVSDKAGYHCSGNNVLHPDEHPCGSCDDSQEPWAWHMPCNGCWMEVKIGPPTNLPPEGSLDGANCNNFWGWARDPDAPGVLVDIRFYADGAAETGTFVGSTTIDAFGGFSFTTPDFLKDEIDHEVYAYGIDAQGGENFLLEGSPKKINCSPPPGPELFYFNDWEYEAMLAKLDNFTKRYGERTTQDGNDFAQCRTYANLALAFAVKYHKTGENKDKENADWYWNKAFEKVKLLNDKDWEGSTRGMPINMTSFIIASDLLAHRTPEVLAEVKRAYNQAVAEFPNPLSDWQDYNTEGETNAWFGAFYQLADEFTKNSEYHTNSYELGDLFAGHVFTWEERPCPNNPGSRCPDTVYRGFYTDNQDSDYNPRTGKGWKDARMTWNRGPYCPTPNYQGAASARFLLCAALSRGKDSMSPGLLLSRNIEGVSSLRHYVNPITSSYKDVCKNPDSDCTPFRQVGEKWISEWGDDAQYVSSGFAFGLLTSKANNESAWYNRFSAVYKPLILTAINNPSEPYPCQPTDFDTKKMVWSILIASHAQSHLALSGWKLGESMPSFEKTDLNQDGKTDAKDLEILLQNWGKPFLPGADLNRDRIVNAADFEIMRRAIEDQ